MSQAQRNLELGRAQRDSQLALFEVRDAAFLSRCRALALVIARQYGEVSINEIREILELPPGVSPNVYGAVFKDRRFKAVGFTQANHPGAHARTIRVYALKGEDNGR